VMMMLTLPPEAVVASGSTPKEVAVAADAEVRMASARETFAAAAAAAAATVVLVVVVVVVVVVVNGEVAGAVVTASSLSRG